MQELYCKVPNLIDSDQVSRLRSLSSTSCSGCVGTRLRIILYRIFRWIPVLLLFLLLPLCPFLLRLLGCLLLLLRFAGSRLISDQRLQLRRRLFAHLA